MRITVKAEELLRLTSLNLASKLGAVMLAVGHEVVDRIAPYPAQPAPADSRHWYERGFGPKWRRKDGSVRGSKTSEQLGRRWAVKPQGQGAVVTNLTSYGPFVQKAGQQTSQHASTGWKTDEGVVQSIQADGTVTRLVEAVVKKQLGV